MKKHLCILLLALVSLQGFSANGKKQIRLRLTDSLTTVFDETSVFLDLGSPQFILSEDGQKVFDTSSSAPSVYSFSSDNVSCFSNSYGTFTPATVIPIGFKTSGAGTFKINANLLDNFDATTIIRLEDRALGVFHDLRQGNYTFYLNQATQNNGRFFLHASYPTLLSLTDAGCGNNDGVISITQDNSISWNTCALYDNNFNLINSYNNVTGNFSFASLPFGNYKVAFTYNNYTTVKDVALGGKSVTVAASATSLTGVVGQQMQFFTSAANATNYVWDFGDGSQINGVMNPTFAYGQAGIYNVSVRASNSFGCSATDNLTVTISEATGINTIAADELSVTMQSKTLSILFAKQLDNESNYQLFNAMGQLVAANTISTNQTNVDLSNLSSGIYIVKVQHQHSSLSKKVVLQ